LRIIDPVTLQASNIATYKVSFLFPLETQKLIIPWTLQNGQ